MSEFIRNKWYSAAVILTLAAIAFQFLAKRYAGLAAKTMARSAESLSSAKQRLGLGLDATAFVESGEHKQLARRAFQYAHHADFWGGVSAVPLLFVLVCWVLARTRPEPVAHWLLLALLSVYVFLLFLIV